MNAIKKSSRGIFFFLGLFISSLSTLSLSAAGQTFEPMVAHDFIKEAKHNTDWKVAFATGEQEQVVFMSISPHTNPNNEIGEEVHPFDQVILIVQGKAMAVLNQKSTQVGSGDLIFVPRGTKHNVINMGKKSELKLVSFYSQNDIPRDAVYKTKADQPNE